jgi:hypothetical protein
VLSRLPEPMFIDRCRAALPALKPHSARPAARRLAIARV